MRERGERKKSVGETRAEAGGVLPAWLTMRLTEGCSEALRKVGGNRVGGCRLSPTTKAKG